MSGHAIVLPLRFPSNSFSESLRESLTETGFSCVNLGSDLWSWAMESISIGSAAIKLTDKILGYNSDDLADILKAIASEIGLLHIAHLRFATDQEFGC